jgi:hypothetical protein
VKSVPFQGQIVDGLVAVGSKNSAELQVTFSTGVATAWILTSQPLDFSRQPRKLAIFLAPTMSFILQPWHILLATICGLVNQRQQQIIEFQNVQIEALLKKLSRKRLLLDDDQPNSSAIGWPRSVMGTGRSPS